MESNGKVAGGTHTLSRCDTLLESLDPRCPPQRATQKEFRWQYRALKERIEVYRQVLSSADRHSAASTASLQKAETALVLSLQYFNSVLKPATDEANE